MRWDKWVGSAVHHPSMPHSKTMLIRWLVKFKSGRRVDLHRMLTADLPHCFHTHPGEAIRIILWGWYVEELEDGTTHLWFPGKVGLVTRACSHRVHATSKRCFTLWIRGREHIPVELRGLGWPDGQES